MQKYLARTPSVYSARSILNPARWSSPSMIQLNVECSQRMCRLMSSAISFPISDASLLIHA